jgi:DNA-binding IclR family transcriptional regulator
MAYDNGNGDDRGTVRSVERAMAVLKCFSHEETEMNLRQISERVNLPKSTVPRILSSLEQGNFVEQDEKRGAYRLSFEMIRLGMVASAGSDLARTARPIMKELSDRTGQTSNLYVIRGFQRLCVEQVMGPQYIRRYSYMGALLPLYGGASGKLLLAYQTPEWLERYFQATELEKMTENTVTDRNTLICQLAQVRRQGYAITHGERDAISSSISAPVFEYSGKLAAALTVSGPLVMFTEENVSRYAGQVVQAARRISERLGYHKQ